MAQKREITVDLLASPCLSADTTCIAIGHQVCRSLLFIILCTGICAGCNCSSYRGKQRRHECAPRLPTCIETPTSLLPHLPTFFFFGSIASLNLSLQHTRC